MATIDTSSIYIYIKDDYKDFSDAEKIFEKAIKVASGRAAGRDFQSRKKQ